MSSVLGLIDVAGVFLLHKEGEILNAELAACLKKLNLNYTVNFHLYTSHSLLGFKQNQYLGIPQFWENYGEISGLNKQAILGNGIFDISKPDSSALYDQGLDKGSPKSYSIIANYFNTDSDKKFLLDDDQNNLFGARLGKTAPIDAKSPDYLSTIENFVVMHAAQN